MTDRVDKQWQNKGLTGYSTAAILGTLNHYGAAVDEEKFKEAAKDRYPLSIAEDWVDGWKGVGQFARFPFAASLELWKRFQPDRLSPMEFAEELGALMLALQQMIQGDPTAPVGPSFETVNTSRARIPQVDGKVSEAFVTECFALLGEQSETAFSRLGEELVSKGHIDDAKTFTDLEEFLYPEYKGVASAVVRAKQGEREAALADLEKIVADPSREERSRISAIDALLHLESYDSAYGHCSTLLDAAEKKKDYHTALAVAQRLLHVAESTKKPQAELEKLQERIQRLVDEHAEAHPGHHH